MKKNEVLTPEVIEELPLEKQIDKTLVKHNVTNAVIAKLKKEYGGLKLNDVNDKENYLIICEAKKIVRKVGIATEKICKEGRSDAIKIQKLWLAKESEILAKIAEVQDPLDAEIKKFEDEQERLRLEEEGRKDNQYNLRQTELIKMGAVIANGCLNLNELAIEISNIRETDDEDYNETILPLFKMQYEKNEQVKVAEQKKKDDEAALLKKQQDELAEQQAALKKQMDELQKQKDDLAKEKAQREQQIVNNRAAELSGIGLLFNGVSYQFADIKIPAEKLKELNDAEWMDLVNETKPLIVEKRNAAQAAQEKRNLGNSRFETLKTIGLIKEETAASLSELSEAEWATLSESYKNEVKAAQQVQWQKDQELEQQRKQQQQKEEQEKASDKENWATFIKALNEFVVSSLPDFKNKTYQSKRTIAKEKFEEISEL